MHQVLRIPEILLNIFGHFSAPAGPLLVKRSDSDNAVLAALARTCRTFKEPALDVLWEGLCGVSPLARCLPEVCRLAGAAEIASHPLRLVVNGPWYLFSRPLTEAEWNTLRGYTRRVRLIHSLFEGLHEDTMREILSRAPFDDPLFPHLQSLHWNGPAEFVPLHVVVPSLTTLCFSPDYLPCAAVEEFFNAFGDRCPHIEKFVVGIHSSALDSTISRVICRWPKLQEVCCSDIPLNMDAISHLSSVSGLNSLFFTPEIGLVQDMAHLDSKLVFSNLTNLYISSKSIDVTISLLSHLRLPIIETFHVNVSGCISKRAIQAYWAAVQEGCPSNNLAYLQLCDSTDERGGDVVPLNEEVPFCITLEDLRPCTAFASLRDLYFNFNYPIRLTDSDLLQLVTPRMEKFLVNCERGWKIAVDGGGITLSGLVRLLRQCPSLNDLCLAIDTRTFTEIPDGLDISFPPRERLLISLMDSYILPEFVPGLVSVFTALRQDPTMDMVWEISQWTLDEGEARRLWEYVLDGLENAS